MLFKKLIYNMNTIIDMGVLPDLIHILIRDEEIFKKMKKDFPSVAADLVSLKSTANCSCRAKIANFFSDRINENQSVLDKYYKDQDAIVKEIEELKKKRLENIISGKIFKVALGNKAWEEFNSSIAGKSYRTFSIVKEDDHLLVYFL